MMASQRWMGLAIASGCLVAVFGSDVQTRFVDRKLLGDEIVKLVGEHFYDPKVAAAWAARHAGYAKSVEDDERFAALTNQILSDLKVSHTGYYTPADARYFGLKAIFAEGLKAGPVEWDSPGADFTSENVVRVVFAGGPASKAGLRRGDKVLFADGKDFYPIKSFRGRVGSSVVLTVRRSPHTPTINFKVSPTRINPKKEWLDAQRQGARLIARNGKTAAYVPMFSAAGEEYQDALQELFTGTLRDADALILDFRDGFGGANPQFVNLFNRTPAVLSGNGRDGKPSSFDSQWRKPLVVLINGGTTSGKEVVAYSIKKHRLGTLVGRRTAGAVVAGRCFFLSDQSLMYLAVRDVRVDGERLEGVGVAPDVEVADRLIYADGADPQLDKAIDVATN